MSAPSGGASRHRDGASRRHDAERGPRRDPGLVVATYRRRVFVDIGASDPLECQIKGRRLTLACGDRVTVEHDGALGVVVEAAPRTSLLYRSDAWREKLVAANVTQVIALVAPDVPVDEHLLNRWIIAAEAERCRFVLAVNKADLPNSDTFMARFAPYRALGYPVIALSALRDAGPLAPWIVARNTVLIGQSGMGKSTLVNALMPGADAPTREISNALRSGRHTTSASTLYRLDRAGSAESGWIIDSPGMTLFGLAHYSAAEIEHAFVELRALPQSCRFRNCRHDREPGCAVLAALSEGRVAPQRAALLRTLVSESETAAHAARRS